MTEEFPTRTKLKEIAINSFFKRIESALLEAAENGEAGIQLQFPAFLTHDECRAIRYQLLDQNFSYVLINGDSRPYQLIIDI